MVRTVPEIELTETQSAQAAEIAAACGLHRLTAEILVSRGVDTPEKAQRFLNPSSSNFLSPYRMSGMDILVRKIREVKEAGGVISVYGDYDADGIGAASILTGALNEFGVRARAHIPERADGYGMKKPLLEKIIREDSPSLLITVDCGVSNREEAAFARSRGVDIVITDHHVLPDDLPDCTVINPKNKDDYPYDNLCGAGVAFKIACALLGEKAYKYLDIAAVSTVADSVPLTGENRDIVAEGLKRINRSPRRAIANLLTSRKEEVRAQNLAFTVAPRVNAAGRMGDAACALKLFTATDPERIDELSSRLHEYNAERQRKGEEIQKAAMSMLEEQGACDDVILLCGAEWEQGTIGITAARLVEEFARPVILFTRKNGVLRGSARAPGNFSIYNALNACRDLLLTYGGHAQAAGVSLKEENFPAFRERICAFAAENYTAEDFVPVIRITADTMPGLALAKELELLEPCGVGNPRPVFALRGNDLSVRPMKHGSPHVLISEKGTDLVWFGGAAGMADLEGDRDKTLLYECGVSTFRGTESVRCTVQGMLLSGPGGELSELRRFSNLLRSAAAGGPDAQIVYGSEKETAERIIAARGRGRYGLLVIGMEPPADSFREALAGMETEYFRPGSTDVGNALVLAPDPDADFSFYREIILLETPAGCANASLRGKTAFANRDRSVLDLFVCLDPSRETMGKIYLSMKRAYPGRNVYEAALLQKEFPAKQFLFAELVFLELGLIGETPAGFHLIRGKKTDLTRSALYSAVAAARRKTE